MYSWLAGLRSLRSRFAMAGAACAAFILSNVSVALAQTAPDTAGGEAGLKLPDLSQVTFLGMDGHKLLTIGILFVPAVNEIALIDGALVAAHASRMYFGDNVC